MNLHRRLSRLEGQAEAADPTPRRVVDPQDCTLPDCTGRRGRCELCGCFSTGIMDREAEKAEFIEGLLRYFEQAHPGLTRPQICDAYARGVLAWRAAHPNEDENDWEANAAGWRGVYDADVAARGADISPWDRDAGGQYDPDSEHTS